MGDEEVRGAATAAENSFIYCLIMEVTRRWPGEPGYVAPLNGGGDLVWALPLALSHCPAGLSSRGGNKINKEAQSIKGVKVLRGRKGIGRDAKRAPSLDSPHEFEVKTFCACLLSPLLATW